MVVPGDVRTNFPSINNESTDNIAKDASFSLEYVIYTEKDFLFVSLFVLEDKRISSIFPYWPKYSIWLNLSVFKRLDGNPWTCTKFFWWF